MGKKETCCCQKPDQLKGKPQECSPEQIKKCHGDDPDHQCHADKNSEK